MGAMARSMYSWVALSGSISIAHKLDIPWIGVILWPMACSKTSARFEAGSVVTMRVFLPSSASRTARVHAIEVLPTPPLPEKKIYWVAILIAFSKVFLDFSQLWIITLSDDFPAHNHNRQRCHLLLTDQLHNLCITDKCAWMGAHLIAFNLVPIRLQFGDHLTDIQ